MNRRRMMLVVLASMIVKCSPILAQGLIIKLPADGSWSRFRVTGQYDVSLLRNPNEFPDTWKEAIKAIPDFAHGEMELFISSVGSEEIDGERFRWIELFQKKAAEQDANDREEDGGTLLRLQIAEKVLSNGGDPLDNARVVIVRGGYSDKEDGEIKSESRKKYELQCFRQFFPKYTLNEKDWAHARGLEKIAPQPVEIGRAHRFRFNYQGKMHGGEHGSIIHHANYTVIADPTAPFGVKQIWETDGVTIEDSGPFDPTNNFCDGPGTISRGNSQIALIESGTGAVSRIKPTGEQQRKQPLGEPRKAHREEPFKGLYKLQFSGKDSYVRIPRLRYDGSHPITLEANVTPHALDGNPRRSSVLGNVELSGLALIYQPSHWLFHFNDGRPDNRGYVSTGSADEAELNRQVHVAGVFDGKTVSIFVDGKPQPNAGATMMPHRPSAFDFMVGADPNKQGKPHQFFKGTIDEVRISNIARYKDAFKPSTEKFKTDGSTLVLYHFDEGEGDVAKDASDNKYDGQIHGAKWVPDTVKTQTTPSTPAATEK